MSIKISLLFFCFYYIVAKDKVFISFYFFVLIIPPLEWVVFCRFHFC